MKKLLMIALPVALFAFTAPSDNGGNVGKSVPSVTLKDMDGNTVKTDELENDGPIVISFWATWCKPCMRELNTINEEYVDWQEETGVKLIAVSIDDERTKARVPTVVNGMAWDYEILMDPNGDFKRALGIQNVPHTLILNKDKKIVWEHNNYSPGDEEELYEKLVELSEK